MVRMEWMFYCISFLYFLHEGSSLICYSCSASVGHSAACENITERFSEISHQECDYNNAVCAKYKVSHGSDTIIYRSCKNVEVCFALAKRYNSQYDHLLDCHTCNDGDFCNSTSTNIPWLSLMKLSIFSLILCILSCR